MNLLIENNYVSEMPCGANFSYILNKNCDFLSTQYKVLRSSASGCFVECMKMMYNGNIQLYYMTSKYKPLSSLLPSLDADNFYVICANLISNIIDVKNSGFLGCQNIDISFNRIYIDQSTYKVNLLYLPVRQTVFEDIYAFENELRTSLIKHIQSIPSLSSPRTIKLAADLANGSLTLENLAAIVKGGSKATDAASFARVKLVALDAPMHLEIPITKDDFTIGKKPDSVDGVVSFNKLISRSHCKISKGDFGYIVSDLESLNGTFVNQVRVYPGRSHPIKNGDILRLANSNFRVVVE